MNRQQLNEDAKELHKIMNDPDYWGTKIYVLAVVLWHVLCWIERRTK